MEKSKPYGQEEMNEVSYRAYQFPAIRNLCKEWKDGQENLGDMEKDIKLSLLALRSEFPRLLKWDDSELIAFLMKNWDNADSIQGNRNKEILWQQKKMDLEDRESTNPSNELKVETDKYLKTFKIENGDTLDW